MAVIINNVIVGSPCHRKGICPGDTLVSIDGEAIDDVLDYRYYAVNKNPVFELITKDGKKRVIKLRKKEDEDPGLEFETYLMDKQHRCRNKCMFCFIDQLPSGLRESLYFKDDDSRLSFLFGNYITLTNLTDREAERIIKMRISPVNVSVHTMNPGLRSKMMGNPEAGESLKYLTLFAQAGIRLNSQLVLCPGINDGDELRNSLSELGKLGTSLQSIAAVPVGLTGYRENLPKLRPFDKQGASAVIDIIDEFNQSYCGECGESIAFAADEFYLLAERPVPSASTYGEFHQLENGVGLWALFRDECCRLINEKRENADLPNETLSERSVSIVTGEVAYPLIRELVDEVVNKWHNLKVKTYPIKNHFFGGEITVAGLITGSDIVDQLKGLSLGEELLIPAVALRREGDMFLDSMTLSELSEKLGVKVRTVPVNADDFLNALLYEE